MKTALRIDNLSKHYCVDVSSIGQYQTLRESLMHVFSAPWRRLRRAVSKQSGPGGPGLWALRGVSFEVQPGEVVGIIGRNGAGKSTLLKILSRVTEPTCGRAELRGRIGSLLEVGTGFHPELTGRENIFLNGAILGMTRLEIKRRFDEIVAFAEIERFLDMPVKRYSSGMYVRLAFAVAAHLEPEILVVDEVLAVGDVSFQKKCMSKMQDVGRQGRTVLFVSHNLTALKLLCRRGIVLQEGELAADSPVGEALAFYMRGLEAAATTDLAERTDRWGSGPTRLMRVEITGGSQGESGQVVVGRPAQFAFHVNQMVPGLTCIFNVVDQFGHCVTRFNSGLGSIEDTCDGKLGAALVCSVDEMLLAPGRYRLDVSLRAHGERQDRVDAAAFLDVKPGMIRGRDIPHQEGGCVFSMPHLWKSPT